MEIYPDRANAVSWTVDTLFAVSPISSILASCWKRIEARIIERFILCQHPVDGMQQFAHHGADRDASFAAQVGEMFEADFALSREYRLDEWRARPWYYRIQEWFWGGVDAAMSRLVKHKDNK